MLLYYQRVTLLALLIKKRGYAKINKITAKYITDNIEVMRYGKRVFRRGAEYWIDPFFSPDVILYISSDRAISGSINGVPFAVILDGVPFRV